MQEENILYEVLDLKDPWQVMKTSVDRGEKRFDVYLGYKGGRKKGIFGFVRKMSDSNNSGRQTCPYCHVSLPEYKETETVTVRHLPMSGFSTYLHVPPSNTFSTNTKDCICARQWHKPGTVCSPELYDLVVEMLQGAKNPEVVGNILGLSSVELAQVMEVADIPLQGALGNKDSAGAGVAQATGIPQFTHPNWMRLVRRELPFETKMVALNMLLGRIQANFEKEPTADIGVTSVKALRKFFVRNEKLLKKEIATIKGDTVSPDVPSGQIGAKANDHGNIPELSSAIWQLILDEQFEIKTKNIALLMLISQFRKKVRLNQDNATVEAAKKNIRNFFIRNESRLQSEVAQLQENGTFTDTKAEGE
jgi:hypothetical protein